MKLEYTSFKDKDLFALTDFTCYPSLKLLRDKSLFKILWCRNSGVTMKVDGCNLSLEKNQVLFCTPLNLMEMKIRKEGLISFIFNSEFFCIQTHDEEVSCNGALFFGSAQPQIIELCEKELKHFEMTLYFFEEEFQVKDKIQGEMLRTLLKRLLITSTRIIKKDIDGNTVPNVQFDLIRQFNILVEQHYKEKHQVGDYAMLLYKSPKTLSNLFRKYNAKTPLMMIHERILLEAKRLLIYSNKTTDEIARELGYKEVGHFSKFFKRHEGVSPKEFKNTRINAA